MAKLREMCTGQVKRFKVQESRHFIQLRAKGKPPTDPSSIFPSLCLPTVSSICHIHSSLSITNHFGSDSLSEVRSAFTLWSCDKACSFKLTKNYWAAACFFFCSLLFILQVDTTPVGAEVPDFSNHALIDPLHVQCPCADSYVCHLAPS